MSHRFVQTKDQLPEGVCGLCGYPLPQWVPCLDVRDPGWYWYSPGEDVPYMVRVDVHDNGEVWIEDEVPGGSIWLKELKVGWFLAIHQPLAPYPKDEDLP